MGNEKIIVGLIRGRHEMPVDRYIFDSIDNVFAFNSMRAQINDFLKEEVGIAISDFRPCINQAGYTDVESFIGCKDLVVYVTGLTAVTAELIGCCARNGVSLTLMHYNNQSNEYVEQKVL